MSYRTTWAVLCAIALLASGCQSPQTTEKPTNGAIDPGNPPQSLLDAVRTPVFIREPPMAFTVLSPSTVKTPTPSAP
jgi:hypothetical protein